MNNPTHRESVVKDVESREELIYLLSRASELEHGLACVYLYAAYSLKSNLDEGGMTEEQLTMVKTWKRKLAMVAVEEMLHLAQVNNMLTAIGGAPNFKRANFPLPVSAFPFGIKLTLEPFSLATIERLVIFELPEEGVLEPVVHAQYGELRNKVVREQELEYAELKPRHFKAEPELIARFGSEAFKFQEPYEIDFTTVGEFYHKVASGFKCIPEDVLFIGPKEAQANARYVDLSGKLISVVNRESALQAIEMIVEQGEAPTQQHPDCHFEIFDTIRKQYISEMEKAANTNTVFDPVRKMASNPMTRFYDDATGGTLILDEDTHCAADIFNMSYDTMLQMLLRFFAHSDETEEELEMLSRATLRIMTTVIRPMGEALAKMPLGDPENAALMAGPGFGYNRDITLLPHKESAWVFFCERLFNLAKEATALAEQKTSPPEVKEASAALQALSELFIKKTAQAQKIIPKVEFVDPAKLEPEINPSTNGPYLVKGVSNLLNSKGERLPAEPQMALCRCGGSANKPFCDGTHARIGFDSSKLPGRTPDRLDKYPATDFTVCDNRGICQHSGFCTDELPEVFRLGKEPFVDQTAASGERISQQTKRCPSGALSFSFANPKLNLPVINEPTITVSKNGPYRVKGSIKLDADFLEGASKEHYTLCRCGGSKNKPFCDGTHWYNNFTDDKN
ncbi:ferritin-like domain-containing protein [Mucilaginibacter sp. Mucisp84]|uniref:ferritin-like domain-containing protein n=1 Tax=Mucilaginibacter sp. Mucisp84 TaxID=3243058 RepID=UPI0039A5E13C